MAETTIYRGPHGHTATLTTDSSLSSYGMPVLRLEGPGMDTEDFGPADLLPSGVAAEWLVRCVSHGELPANAGGELIPLDAEGQDLVNKFLRLAAVV